MLAPTIRIGAHESNSRIGPQSLVGSETPPHESSRRRKRVGKLLNNASQLCFRQGTRYLTGARVFVLGGLHPVRSGR